MNNILDLVKGYLSPALISQASSLLGESEGNVSNTLGAAIPAILGGLLNKTGDTNAMASIFSLITHSSQKGDVLSSLGSLLGEQNANNPFLEIGGKFLGGLFGNKTGDLINLVASTSGVKKESASSLIGMAVPLIMGVLGKKIAGDGLNASTFVNYLLGQKNNILSAAPAGMLASLGLGGLSNLGTNSSSSSTSSEDNKAGMGWILPAVLGLALMGGLFYFMKGCNGPKADGVDKAAEVAAQTVDSAAIKAELAAKAAASAVDTSKKVATDLWASLGKLMSRKLPNGIELSVPENGVENKLIAFIEDKAKAVDKTTWFDFDRLLFDTGKSTLKAESAQQLKDAAAILKAYPQVELKIGGYTDNTGKADANLKLSDDRAKAVVAELVKLGVDAKRLAGEGYGDKFPVGDNTTEEGRAKNRRISMRVTKK